MSHRDIPVYELSDYRQSDLAVEGVSVMRLEDSLAQHRDRMRPHYHPFFQVFLMSGSGVFMHDFVDYQVDGNTLAFASPGQVHAVLSNRGVKGVFVCFTQAFFDNAAPPPSRLLDFPFFFAATHSPLLKLKAAEYLRMQHAFAELLSEFDKGEPGVSDVLRAYLAIIFTRAARLYHATHEERTESARPAQLIRSFRMAVENHFRELTSPAKYAAMLEVTTNHLNDTVREQTGQSAGSLIRQRRLLDAKRLLLHSELSVSEIAYHLGFADPSYFSRFFRRDTGGAPNDFRVAIREKYQKSAGLHP